MSCAANIYYVLCYISNFSQQIEKEILVYKTPETRYLLDNNANACKNLGAIEKSS